MCKGYRILGHRLRTPYSDVDVAAWKDGVLVIVEVKARNTYAAGAYAVTPIAQQRIARSAGARWPLAADVGADPLRFGSGWFRSVTKA